MKPSKRSIKRLAYDLEKELHSSLSIMEFPDDSFIFRGVIIKRLENDNWGLIHLNSRDVIDQFFLRTAALLAADAYYRMNLNEANIIKRLDTHYWSHSWDLAMLETNIKVIKNKEKYLITLDKLENSQYKKKMFGDQLTKKFRLAFIR